MSAAAYDLPVSTKGAYRRDYAESAQRALVRYKEKDNPTGQKLTDDACGELLETSGATINLVANGKRPMQMPLAIALSAALDCTLDDLFLRDGIRSGHDDGDDPMTRLAERVLERANELQQAQQLSHKKKRRS